MRGLVWGVGYRAPVTRVVRGNFEYVTPFDRSFEVAGVAGVIV